MDANEVSVGQLSMVIAAIVAGALVIAFLWVDRSGSKSSAVTTAKPLSAKEPVVHEAESEQARALAEPSSQEPDGKALPVRVLYASSLGTAKGACGVA